MVSLLPLFFGLCVAAGSCCLSAKDAVPACAVNDVEVFERQDVDGKPMISGVFRIEAPKGFWLPEPAFLIWKHGNVRSFWCDRFAPRWIAMDSQGKVVPQGDADKREVQAMFSFRMNDDDDSVSEEESQSVRLVARKGVPVICVEGKVHAPARFWLDGKLRGEVQMMVAPRKFMWCEASPAWKSSSLPMAEKLMNPKCEMHVLPEVKEMQAFVAPWMTGSCSVGYWSGRDGGGVVQNVCFMPDYKPQPGDVFYKVSFTARDRVFRRVSLVPEDGDLSTVRLIGYSMMELGGSARGQWEESYLFVMPREDGKARVKWEEQRVQEVRVPVLLDMADVPWRRK